jgi:CRISPR-associated endonuclease/helicase Cas3
MHPVLGKRIAASKPARLAIAERAKGKNATVELVKALEKHARELSSEFSCVGIIVNRVKTARQLATRLGNDTVLLTGRMRPLDRDRLCRDRLTALLSSSDESSRPPPKFVVGTQCLECGADFDFHALVTECASLDALQQRFGRLNRVAKRTAAKAVIVVRADQTDDTSDDPVYGESLARTWQALRSKAAGDVFDFGIAAVRRAFDGVHIQSLNAASMDAPALLPVHLDCLVQTSPKPCLDVVPAVFLHGPTAPSLDVQVVFRSDLGDDPSLWTEIVSLCPPSSSEAMPVPIYVFKQWLASKSIEDDSGDVEGETAHEEHPEDSDGRFALDWLGPEESKVISSTREVAPNHVYVIPCASPDAAKLGDFVGEAPSDDAEEAFQHSRDKALLRLRDLVIPEDAQRGEIAELISDAVGKIENTLGPDSPQWLRIAVNALKAGKRCEVAPHPLGGVVVTGKARLHKFDPTYLDDTEPDESFRGEPVTLVEHSRGVAEYARRFAQACALDMNLYTQAGLLHDLGKLDPRFQAKLKDASPRTAAGVALAKSGRPPRTRREEEEARQVHRYPLGARHELLSAAIVGEHDSDDLLLHLIATHHGSARPFADPVTENEAASIPCRQDLFGLKPKSCKQCIEDWNAELPERFWRVVRRLGWWGAAYHESVFRLADHAQSRAEQEGCKTSLSENTARPWPFSSPVARQARHTMALPGLHGTNPLAYLAALGTLVLLDRISQLPDRRPWLDGTVALSWEGCTPILQLAGGPPAPDALVDLLTDKCSSSLDQHAARFAVSLFESKDGLASRIREFAMGADGRSRLVLDWLAAHGSEVDPDATSQLLAVRRDYFPDNVRSILGRCRREHLVGALFRPWDYADALDNQSLHWEPSEDRRHAYQWHMPSGDPTRKRRGGMLGANRLALEAWPLFPLLPTAGRMATRGFQGNRARDTFWTWPLWRPPLSRDSVASLLGLDYAPTPRGDRRNWRALGVLTVFRSQRITVGKTPNFTTAVPII